MMQIGKINKMTENNIHDSIWNIFQMHVTQTGTASEVWSKFVTVLGKQMVTLPTNQLLQLQNINQDIIDLTAWWKSNIAQVSKTKSKTKAIWIALQEYDSPSGEGTNYAYTMRGCSDYDDEHNFWVKQIAWHNEQLAIAPDSILEVQEIIKSLPSDQWEILDWILPLALSCFIFNEIITQHIDKSALLHDQKIVEAALGYMDGDYMGLAPITVGKKDLDEE